MNGDTHWLNRKRLTVYPRLMLALILVFAVAWVLLSKNTVDLKGKPLGYDFITFWAASHMGLNGHAAQAYSIPFIVKAEKTAVPASHSVFVWYYPPSFYLLILPLALLPYLVAYWAFVLSTLICYLLVFRRIVRDRSKDAMWFMAGFSGLWMNLFHGQNAFLTAAIAGAALVCLEQRPVLAGFLIGLLAVKPHLALLFPVALIAIGAWRAFVTAIAFMAVGTVILGRDTLNACLHSLGYARIFLENGFLPWPKMPTVFAFLRLLHVPVVGAYVIHAVVAAGAVFAVWRVWRHSPDWQMRAAALMTATFLISPYVFDYDLAWLAFPIAWITLAGLRDGWLKGEREILVAAWALPLLMTPIALELHIQIGPFVLGTLLWMIMRRTGTGFFTIATVFTRVPSESEYAL